MGVIPFVLGACNLYAHPYYVSLTEIRYHSDTRQMDVSVRMFTDDLQLAIRKINGIQSQEPLYSRSEIDSLLSIYIHHHLKIELNGQLLKFDFIGFELEDESTWSYLECKNISTFSIVKITNTLLFDFIDGQVNMMHFYYDTQRKSTKLNQPDSEWEIIW